jgi:hypothetical protein
MKDLRYLRDPLDHRNFLSSPKESQLWHDIRMAATTNEDLREALDRIKIMYYLSNEHADRHFN